MTIESANDDVKISLIYRQIIVSLSSKYRQSIVKISSIDNNLTSYRQNIVSLSSVDNNSQMTIASANDDT